VNVSRRQTSARYPDGMGNVEKLEREIQGLSPEHTTKLREWFAAFDAEASKRRMASSGSGSGRARSTTS
jgi:hypothetical protein